MGMGPHHHPTQEPGHIVNINLDLSPVLHAIHQLREDIMSTFADLAATIDTIQTEIGAVQTDVTRVIDLIRAMPDPNTLSAENQAHLDNTATALQGIADALAGVDASIDAVSPDPMTTAAEEATPAAADTGEATAEPVPAPVPAPDAAAEPAPGSEG
jgi:hypothetical protein